MAVTAVRKAQVRAHISGDFHTRGQREKTESMPPWNLLTEMIVNILKKEETSFPKMPFERTLRHIWPRYHFLNSAYFAYFSVRFQSTEIDCVCVGFSTRANTGVRQTQTADLQTCRLADLQTCRLADLQTRRPCRLADFQTGRPADWHFPINFENNIVQPSPFPRHTFAASYL